MHAFHELCFVSTQWLVATVDAVAPASTAEANFLASAEVWCHTVLVWIGFGTLAGLVAKAMMPGRDPGGAVATLLVGVGGSVIGCGTLTYLTHGVHVSPISPIGFAVATGGAFVLLAIYKLFAGRPVREIAEGQKHPVEESRSNYRPYRRRRSGSRQSIVD